ncbi:hypothetical protein AURDEDRAFT_89096 [Auricularia subglabra TFB-10046 SS5]|nr:hypothetical protein AURDEDRAFT_89096 [Auricularia subglabra TFB-10046 SS5]
MASPPPSQHGDSAVRPKSFSFIGLGLMGAPMAHNLLKALPSNTPFTIYDVSPSAMEKFLDSAWMDREVPIYCAATAADAILRSSCILSCVPEGTHVLEVYRSVAPDAYTDKLCVDLSTIDVATSRRVGELINGAGTFYDAPVSGGVLGARRGTLTVMIGASEDDSHIATLREILRPIGSNIFACGGPGMGLVSKFSNNYLSGLTAIATSEAMMLGMAHGMDPKLLSSIFAASTGSNWVNSHCNPVPGVTPEAAPSRNYEGGFKVQLMRKDFHLAVEAAKDAGVPLRLGQVGLDIYTEAMNDERCRDRDSRVVYRYLGGKE